MENYHVIRCKTFRWLQRVSMSTLSEDKLIKQFKLKFIDVKLEVNGKSAQG